MRECIRYFRYSIRTEEAYVHWVRAFIRFHGLRHPASMGGVEVEAFLSWLANARSVAASTHKQALSALLFFYRKVLGTDLPWMTEIGMPRTKRRLPVVLSPDEVSRIFCLLDGEHRLFAQLLYGRRIEKADKGDRYPVSPSLIRLYPAKLGAVVRSSPTGGFAHEPGCTSPA